MQTLSLEFDNYIDPLIAVLDKDIEHIDSTVEMLDQLRGMVIKRDDKGLNLLVEKARIKSQNYTAIENRREMIRGELARIWGCRVSEMTLTKIIQILGPERSEQIRRTRDRLQRRLERFKAEHLSTYMLLSECSRFNGEMLSALLSGRSDETTYNRRGSMNRHNGQSFVNMKL